MSVWCLSDADQLGHFCPTIFFSFCFFRLFAVFVCLCFCPFVFLSSCLFAFLSSCLFAFLSFQVCDARAMRTNWDTLVLLSLYLFVISSFLSYCLFAFLSFCLFKCVRLERCGPTGTLWPWAVSEDPIHAVEVLPQQSSSLNSTFKVWFR